MSISARCPSCSARIAVSDRLSGLSVPCPKCRVAVPVPAADPGFQVVDGEGPVVPRPKVKPPEPKEVFSVQREEMDAEGPKPRKLPAWIEAGEEFDDPPLPRRDRLTESSPVMIRIAVLLVGTVVFLAALTGGVYYALGKVSTASAPPPPPAPQPTAAPPPAPAPAAPAEWKAFHSPDGTFSAPLPGTPTRSPSLGDLGLLLDGTSTQSWELNTSDLGYKMVVVTVEPALAGIVSDDQVLGVLSSQWADRAARDPGAKQAPAWLGKHPARQFAYAEGAEHTVLRLAVTGNRLLTFAVVRRNKPIDPGEEGVRKFLDGIVIR